MSTAQGFSCQVRPAYRARCMPRRSRAAPTRVPASLLRLCLVTLSRSRNVPCETLHRAHGSPYFFLITNTEHVTETTVAQKQDQHKREFVLDVSDARAPQWRNRSHPKANFWRPAHPEHGAPTLTLQLPCSKNEGATVNRLNKSRRTASLQTGLS